MDIEAGAQLYRLGKTRRLEFAPASFRTAASRVSRTHAAPWSG